MGNGTMTVNDILVRVQRSFGDEAAVQLQQADVIRWINDAQREAVMQHENLLQTEAFISSVVGQNAYTLPSNCFTLDSVYYRDSADTSASYFALRYFPREKLDSFADGWQGNYFGNGCPQVFSRGPETQTKSSLLVFPAPDAVRTNGIKVVYARYATDVVNISDDIDLPAFYYGYVEHYCMMKAYEMDEDWESADRKAALVQSTLDFNNNREEWFGRDSYPSINTSFEDYL